MPVSSGKGKKKVALRQAPPQRGGCGTTLQAGSWGFTSWSFVQLPQNLSSLWNQGGGLALLMQISRGSPTSPNCHPCSAAASLPSACSPVSGGMGDVGHGTWDGGYRTWDMRHRTWDTGHLPAAVPNPAHPKEAPEPKWSSNIFVLSFT